ncbi:MAG: FeoA family protein [Chloroflexota bacterium]|nr:FeoA family protein [Chloroflexota bacterium]
MSEKIQITASHLQPGQSGRVVQIQGGHGIANRLYAMGIRPGKKVTKVSSMFMRGPVTLRVGQMQVAIGYGMAGKIIVEVE